MHLDQKQRSVALGMAAGLAASWVVVCFGSTLFIHLNASERIGSSLLLPAVALFVAIARLARQRFFSPADIDGSALTAGTDRSRLLQALLQNTLEQLALAVPVYMAALFNTSPGVQATVPACACAFLLGRILFFAGYQHGAGARVIGFALTFYPTVLLLAWQLWLLSSKLFG